MPQLARITFQSASLRYFRWPYQAKVMKIFEIVSNRMVRTKPPSQGVVMIETGGEQYQVTTIVTECGQATGRECKWSRRRICNRPASCRLERSDACGSGL